MEAYLCAYYGVDRSGFKRHDALGDAKPITRIFQAELVQAKWLGVNSLAADRIRIKRFVLPPGDPQES